MNGRQADAVALLDEGVRVGGEKHARRQDHENGDERNLLLPEGQHQRAREQRQDDDERIERLLDATEQMPAHRDERGAEQLRAEGNVPQGRGGCRAACLGVEQVLYGRERGQGPDDRRDGELRQAELPPRDRQNRRQQRGEGPGVVEHDLVAAQLLHGLFPDSGITSHPSAGRCL